MAHRSDRSKIPMFGSIRALSVVWSSMAMVSCLSTHVEDSPVEEAPFAHYAHFRGVDTSLLPDSLWYRSQRDSGSAVASSLPAKDGRHVAFFPVLHPLGRDSLAVEAWKLGLRTATHYLRETSYGELVKSSDRVSAADSQALFLLRIFDSISKTLSAPGLADTTRLRKREFFQRTTAQLVFEGHPATARLLLAPPRGLDTADLARRTLDLAMSSDLSLAQITQRWTLRLNYPQARQILQSRGMDSLPLNPFHLSAPLLLDTLRLGEPAIGLRGRILARLGIQSLNFSLADDSGDRSDRFSISDPPQPGSSKDLDLSGHPLISPKAKAAKGRYTLSMTATDSFGNQAVFRSEFWVKETLDHQPPALEPVEPKFSVVRAFKDSLLKVRVKATDPSGIRKVAIGGVEATRDTAGIWFGDLVVGISPDSRPLAVTAEDSAGNLRTIELLVRRDPPPEPTPPRLHLAHPAHQTMIPFDSSGIRVAWTAQTDFGRIRSVTIGGSEATNIHDSTWEVRLELAATGALSDIGVEATSTSGLRSTGFVSVGRGRDSAGPALKWVSPLQNHRVDYETHRLDVAISAIDLSGVDSVRIGGRKADTSGGIWLGEAVLGPPGQTTAIHVMAWDRSGNQTDSVLKVVRDPIPNGLKPSFRWIWPSETSGTILPFDSAGIWIRCVLKDISGIDSSSVEIGNGLATPVDDSTWTRHVEIPPTGKETVVTLQLKNKRGVPNYGFVGITRKRDTVPPTCGRTPLARAVVPFDTTSMEVGWTARDNDRVANAWIAGQPVPATGQGFFAIIPLAVGRQWIRFRAEDPAGNAVFDSVSVERRSDSTPPNVQRLPGTTPRSVPFDTVSVSVGWQVHDNDRVANGWIQDLSVNPVEGRFVSNVPLAAGRQWVKFLAEDPSGNSTRDSLEFLRGADTTRPKVTATPHNRPRTVAWDSMQVLVGWTASDNDRVAKAWIQGVEVGATSEGFLRLVPLVVGSQWIRFRATDPTGNESLDSFRIVRSDLDPADPVVASDTNSRLRGGSFLVELATTSPFWPIHYTLDGSDPTEQSPRYGYEPGSNHDGQWGVLIDTSCTLKARAFASNRSPGPILTQRYQLALPVAVSSSVDHSLFLLEDGSLWAAGYNRRNAFFPGAQELYLTPVKIADSVMQMSAGFDYSVWVKKDGSLWGIGANDSGNLGIGILGDQSVPVLIRRDVAKVQAYQWKRILVLDKSGTLWAAGTNLFGQLGTGKLGYEPSLTRIATDVSKFGGGDAHTMILKTNGSLWATGAPWNCRLGFWSDTNALVPTFSMDSVQGMAEKMGNTSFVQLRNGSWMEFGENAFGSMGTGDTQSIVTPRRMVELEAKGNITNIASHFHTLAITSTGEVWATGYNQYHQVSSSTSERVLSPQLALSNAKSIFAGPHSSFAITKSGCLFAWGNNSVGLLGIGTVGDKTDVTRVKF